jgi:preprotein translocase subunit SecD
MAVDANVLIFERIREELALGRTVRQAVDNGFGHAMSAIVDSNITTLITALILFQVGTGPVRGFAVTLSIGIVASFFTAVFITRTFFLRTWNVAVRPTRSASNTELAAPCDAFLPTRTTTSSAAAGRPTSVSGLALALSLRHRR